MAGYPPVSHLTKQATATPEDEKKKLSCWECGRIFHNKQGYRVERRDLPDGTPHWLPHCRSYGSCLKEKIHIAEPPFPSSAETILQRLENLEERLTSLERELGVC